MKKKGYYEYENGIYPLKLWVHIGKDLKELIDSCFDKCKAPDIDYGGVTYADAVSERATEGAAFLYRFRVRRLCR